jgi:hypothetical protein
VPFIIRVAKVSGKTEQESASNRQSDRMPVYAGLEITKLKFPQNRHGTAL